MELYPLGPYNRFVRFISPNPATTFQSHAVRPTIDPTAFVGPFSSVIGDVTIEAGVFVAPNVSLRADEGTPFYIGEGTNLQDGVIVHGLKDGKIQVNDKTYSVYVGPSSSIAHGAILHGPVFVGEGTFVGFQSLVFQAIVGKRAYISNNAVVAGKIVIADDRFVPPGAVIDNQAKADALGPLPQDAEAFAKEVQRVNRDFSSGYAMAFGSSRCTCGLRCEL